MEQTIQAQFLRCHNCGKQVSTLFYPIPTPGFDGIVVRAYIECPECIEQRIPNEINAVSDSITRPNQQKR